MNNKTNVKVIAAEVMKEIAAELMKGILPKIVDLQEQIKALDKRVKIVEGNIQNISSVLMNKRKHQKG